MIDNEVYIVDDTSLWDKICINGRPSKKLFEKYVDNEENFRNHMNSIGYRELKELQEKLEFACDIILDSHFKGEDRWEWAKDTKKKLKERK